MPISIRIANREDADIIATFSRQTFYESFAPQNTKENMDKFMNEQFTHEKLMEEVGASGNIFLLAYHTGELVGYARLRENNQPQELKASNPLEIARIYAAQHFIGRGIGKILMQHCIELANAMKKDVIWLGVWEYNQHAIEFYTKWGFKKFGTHEFRLGDDIQTDWLMVKNLL